MMFQRILWAVVLITGLLMFASWQIGAVGSDIRGRVLDSELQCALQGAIVELDLQDTLLRTSSNAEGKFRFRDIPTGQYNIQVRKEGYPTTEVPAVLVEKEQATYLIIKMKAHPSVFSILGR